MSTRVYDLPTRLFHGLFAASFCAAFVIANVVDDESAIFAWHMLAGLLLVFVLVGRGLWGFIGTRHARWSDFQLSPSALIDYGRDVLRGGARRWAGHNPASSVAALCMWGLGLGLGITGLCMAQGIATESLEDVHELLANAFLVVVLLHIAGVILHQWQHKDALGASMVTGRKSGVDAPDVSAHRFAAAVFLLLTMSFAGYLLQHFDQAQGQLQLFGYTLQLTEQEHEASAAGHERDSDD